MTKMMILSLDGFDAIFEHFTSAFHLYITEQVAVLRKTGDRLLVEKDEEIRNAGYQFAMLI